MTQYYLDVSDVLEYFSYQLAASGIQRVQLEIIRHFSRQHADICTFVSESPRAYGFLQLDSALLLEMVERLDGGGLNRQEMDQLLARVRQSARPAIPRQNDVFFVCGAFWATSRTARSLWTVKSSGAKVGFLCYDLIPIRHREFCVEALVEAFTTAFEALAHVVDFICTISVHVQKDVEAYLAKIGLDLPVTALPLAHELNFRPATEPPRERVRALQSRPYVLFVSTIEARKNHAYIFAVWQQLLRTMPETTPDLVWVGRPGWMVDDLMRRIERVDNLGGRLHILSGLSDAELATLYQGCLFTVYPSLAEGWGLPVAESLIFGKPCVASAVDSVPEVGGDFNWYIDPENITEGVAVIGGLIAHPERIAAAEERIAREFTPRSWAQFSASLMTALERAAREDRQVNPPDRFVFLSGVAYGAGLTGVGRRQPTASEAHGVDFLLGDGWYRREKWGRWMQGRRSGLRLARPAHTPAGPTAFWFRFQTLHGWHGHSLTIACPQSCEQVSLMPPTGHIATVAFTMDLPEGSCDLIIEVDELTAPPGDHRELSIGLIAFGYAGPGDETAQAALRKALGQSGRQLTAEPVAASPAILAPLKEAPPPSRARMIAQLAGREGLRRTAGRMLRRLGLRQ